MSKNHNYNNLYNKISSITRKKFLYNDIKVADNLMTRLYLMLIIFAFVLKYFKKIKFNQSFSQNLHDFFFNRLELDFREMGHGDMSVNKKMKDLISLFHEILVYCENWEITSIDKKVTYIKFLFKNDKIDTNFNKLNDFFSEYSTNFEDKSLYSDIKGIMKPH